MRARLNLRSPGILATIGVGATLLLTLVVAVALSRTGGAKAVSDNAALIGALVGLGGVFTTQLVNSVLEDRRAQTARETQEQQQSREYELAFQRSQDDLAQTYLDQMTALLLDQDNPLRQSENDSEVRILARARTLLVLLRLDRYRKAAVVQFLYESSLVTKGQVIVYLEGADLREVYLRYADLSGANLGHAVLSEADLRNADLSGASLRDAYLMGTKLYGATLSGANLEGATGSTNEELEQQAASLEGAIMPDGSTHP